MAFIIIKNGKASENKLVYQGPVLVDANALEQEGTVQVWSMCELEEKTYVDHFLTPQEAKHLAKKLIEQANVIETGTYA